MTIPAAIDGLLADAVARGVTPGGVVEVGRGSAPVATCAAGRLTYAPDAAVNGNGVLVLASPPTACPIESSSLFLALMLLLAGDSCCGLLLGLLGRQQSKPVHATFTS